MTSHPSRRFSWPLAFLSVALLCGAGPGKMESFVSGGTKLSIEVFEPTTSGPHRAVVIAYGTVGMTNRIGEIVTGSADAIRHFAGELVNKGYVVLIPDYFGRTKTNPGLDALKAANDPSNRDAWVQVIEDAMVYADARPGTDKGRVGLLGFSLGGHMVLRAGKEATAVKAKAVVEFAGPTTIYGLGGGLDKLPVLQVHHGLKDMIVDKTQTDALVAALKGVGKRENFDYFVLWYPNEAHVPFDMDPKDAKQAEQSTIAFFDKYL